MDKELLFITVIGQDKKGIVARISGLLYESGVNIEDISQGIMEGYFVMTMAVDMREANRDLESSRRAASAGRRDGDAHPDPAPERVQDDAQDIAMRFDVEELFETASMTLHQNLDIRTTTLGVNLKDCIDSDFAAFQDKVYRRVNGYAHALIEQARPLEVRYGIPIMSIGSRA